jgi:hypothetical protein
LESKLTTGFNRTSTRSYQVKTLWFCFVYNFYLVCQFTFRLAYREYKFFLNQSEIAAFIDCPIDMTVNRIFTDSSRLSQNISNGLQIEIIDSGFYDEVINKLMLNGVQIDNPQIDIKMYLPFRRDRRASVLAQERSSFTSLSGQSGSKKIETSNNLQQSRRAASAAMERPFDFLLKVLTLRNRVGALMKYSFPIIYSVDTNPS